MTDARTVIAKWLDDYIGSRTAEELKSDAATILAALAEAGLVIVPREPTERMKRAGQDSMLCNVGTGVTAMMLGAYGAMLEAADE